MNVNLYLAYITPDKIKNMSKAAIQIEFLRSTLKLSQESFAKKIGFSRSYVRDIELGKAKPSRRFLEEVSKNFGVSADLFLTDLGERIISILDKIPSISGEGFIYLYDYTDKGLQEAENQLIRFLSNFNYLLLDGKEIKSENHFFSLLTGEKGQLVRLWDLFKESVLNNEYKFFVIKNFSLSGVKYKVPVLRGFFRITAMNGATILIDKPCFLERNVSSLYYYAYPIHVSGPFGRVNY